MRVRWTWLLLLWGCGGAQTQGVARPAAEPATAVSPATALRRCLLLTTNDSESNFDGVQRGADGQLHLTYPLARVATAKAKALAERPGGVLLLEGGDVLQGRFLDRQDGDRARAAADNWPLYEAAGYDFGAIGNHEFDNGPRTVRRALLGLQRFRLLAANLDGDGTSLDAREPGRPEGLYGSHALTQCGGIRVGLFGLTTPSTRTISDLGDVRLKPLAATAAAEVAALRAAGAEVVVLLSHLGVDEDGELAAEVPGVDVIVGGHSHTRLDHARHTGATWITQTGARFERLGRIDLAVTPAGKLDPQATVYTLERPDQYAPDPAIVARTDALYAGLVPEKVLGSRAFAWDVVDIAHSQYALRATRAVAQYAARISQRPVDGGLLNTGGFRSHTLYPPGPVTNLDVAAIHPFRNRVVLVSLSGSQLRDVVEHACGHAQNTEHGANSILWGISVRCDTSRPAASYRYVDNKAVALERHGERAQDLRVAGQPVDPARTYTIATLDYLARGGSNYLPLQLGQRACLDGRPFRPEEKAACGETALLADVIAEAVSRGELDQP